MTLRHEPAGDAGGVDVALPVSIGPGLALRLPGADGCDLSTPWPPAALEEPELNLPSTSRVPLAQRGDGLLDFAC
jgi:hypothetical protein